MKKKVSLTVLFFIAIGLLIINSARAYTFDGDIDPKQFFTYEPIQMEQLSQITALMVLRSETLKPRYAVVCIMKQGQGVIILAYAYYDADCNFRHFMITPEGHYNEHPFNLEDEAEKALYDKLNRILKSLLGILTAN